MGLIKKLTDTTLEHLGLVRVTPAFPAPPTLQQPIYDHWARTINPLGLSSKKSMTELAGAHRSWIYSCVRAISFRVAGLPLDLVLNERTKSVAEVTKTEIDDHPFLDMIWKPNPFTTRMELWLTTVNHLDLTGNAYWLLLKDRLGIPREIWPLYPQFMRPIPHKTEFLTGWVYTISTPPIRFDLESKEYKIVHFKYPNPMNPYYGMGPVEAQAYQHDIDLYTEIYQRNFFSEGARPDFVLETDQTITKDDAELIWALWEERHKGVAKSWRPGILGKGLKAKPLNVSNRDLTFAALADWTRDKTLSAFGVPAAKLGLVADANRANSDAADLTFNREAILPRIQLIEERIEMEVLPMYPGQSRTLWLETDFENPVPADLEMELRQRELYLDKGVIVINEVREEDGMDPVAWGDLPLLASGIVPLGTQPTEPTPPTPPADPGTPATPTPEDEPVVPAEEPTEESIEDALAAYWESYVSRTLPQEKALIADLQESFDGLEQRQIKLLKDGLRSVVYYFEGWSAKKVLAHLQRDPSTVDALLFQIDGELPEFVPLMVKHVTSAVNAAGLKAIAEIGIGVWDLQDPLVLEWIGTHGLTSVKGILETTRTALRTTLIDGVSQGESIRELVKRVVEKFAMAKGPRAQSIARTEVNTASSYGRLTAFKQSGVVEMKQWLTARDERVRDTHKAVHGVKMPLHEDFQVGAGNGPAPGQIGIAEEDINCRCTIIAVVAGGKVLIVKAPLSGLIQAEPLPLSESDRLAGMFRDTLKAVSSIIGNLPQPVINVPVTVSLPSKGSVKTTERDEKTGRILRVVETPVEP